MEAFFNEIKAKYFYISIEITQREWGISSIN